MGSALKRYYDEDDVRVRRSGRGSRPRTRIRPAHKDAVQGFVVAVDRGRYTCLVGHDGTPSAGGDGRTGRRRPGRGAEPVLVVAMKARELGRKGIVVGDRVALV